MTHNSSYSEDAGYVNIHGQDVKVFVCEKTGRILVPIDELKAMGFRIYRKSQYSRLLIDENQFNKEFNMFMLQSAQTYMLENKIGFNKNDILDCINKCKSTLTETQTEFNSPPRAQAEGKRPVNNFVKNLVAHSTSGDNRITTNLRLPLSPSPQIFNNSRNLKNESPLGVFKCENAKPRVFGSSLGQKNKVGDHHQSNGFQDSKPSFQERKRDFAEGKPNFQENKRDSAESTSSFRENRNLAKPSFQERKREFSEVKPDFQERKRDSDESTSSFGENRSLPKPSDEQPTEKIDIIKLNKKEHKVIVSFVEKPNCVWVQDFERADTLLEIDSQVKEEVQTQEKRPLKLALNKVYLALDDGMWFRCKVIKFKPLTVFFLDYGNTAQVPEVLEASKELAKIPSQAVRITFPESQGRLEALQEINIQIKKMFENGTYVVDIMTNEEDFSPPEERVPTPLTFFTKPRPLCALQNGQRVLVVSHAAGKVALRTKECHDKFQQIEIALELENSNTKPVDSIKIGQLVLVVKEKLQRGVVLSIGRDEVEVELLDYYDKLSVHSSKLRYISESLAKEPMTLIITPTLKNYTGSDEILDKLVENRAKATVVLTNGEFDLDLGDELLSEKFKPKIFNGPMITDFKIYKPSLGKGSYILNHYVSKDEVYFADTEEMEKYLDDLLITEELVTEPPHKPVLGEVCLGLYNHSWCRCVVLTENGSQFDVNFVDFGNTEILTCNELRKLPESGKDVPILGFKCKLTGLPVVDDVNNALKDIFAISDAYDIDIKKFVGDRYEIEVPVVNEKLKAAF